MSEWKSGYKRTYSATFQYSFFKVLPLIERRVFEHYIERLDWQVIFIKNFKRVKWQVDSLNVK